MKLSILIKSCPYRSIAYTAYSFAKEALKQGNELIQVFFYGEGVKIGLAYEFLPSDEPQLGLLWEKLARDYNLSLVICSSSGIRQGLIDNNHLPININPIFIIRNLSYWVEGSLQSEKVISFG
ncbi:MAG: intracellular sulfur oxidation protein DsrE [Francisellaceae bacterium]|nr:intracellular sulfur oxidation protein DsrE [Francisellaceae bacterium]